MAKSLERYGQLSPVVVCRRGERYELVDGFKRLGRETASRDLQFVRTAGQILERIRGVAGSRSRLAY